VRSRLDRGSADTEGGSQGQVALAAATRLEQWSETRAPVRRRRYVSSLPAALDEVARALRSGSSIPLALAGAGPATGGGPAGSALGRVANRVELGVPLEASLDQLAAEEPYAETQLVVAALAIAADAGGRAAPAVESVSATLRERAGAAQEVLAQSVQARLSAAVIGVLPLAFAVWCITTDDRAAAFLLTTPGGWACAATGLALLVLGAWWMRRIIGSAA
jgi:tight adherence protein B